jgi:glycosyltransferase involved in cell wall biosynthesis
MRVLVWQWGRRGGGPRYAVELVTGLGAQNGVEAMLSLSAQSEILGAPGAPACQLPVRTYDDLAGLVVRLPALPFQVAPLAERVRALRPDVAICAMPAALDLLMAAALRRASVPYFVVVHDADPHPGDGIPLQMTLQRALMRRAHGLVALTGHVAERLRQQSQLRGRPLFIVPHPPRVFGPPPPPPGAHGGKLRLLSFGRLLPYKGLDLLAEALLVLGPRADMEIRVVGNGPESAVLEVLRGIPGVTVENRWVPEDEVGSIIAWADALVLSHREASQSGGAAAAIAAGRWVVATRVGGITEQLRDQLSARLCDPTASSLAHELSLMVERPPPVVVPEDPRIAWRAVTAQFARELAVELGCELPPADQPGVAKRAKEVTSTS